MENFLDAVAKLEFDLRYNLDLELQGYEITDKKESPYYREIKDLEFIFEKLEDVEKMSLEDAVQVAKLVLKYEEELRSI
nr:MAG TPA: hypothetical protein [Caudoviricetes sp.]